MDCEIRIHGHGREMRAGVVIELQQWTQGPVLLNGSNLAGDTDVVTAFLRVYSSTLLSAQIIENEED